MSDQPETTIRFKCNNCDGTIVYDPLAGSCMCDHCGHKWTIEDMVPDFDKYSKAISNIKRANDILDAEPTVTDSEQAKILFQLASTECQKYSGAISSDLIRMCSEGETRAERLKIYARAGKLFKNGTYPEAMEEYRKVQGFKDSDEMIRKCEENIELSKKRQIPLTILTGIIIPLAAAVLLKEKAGLHIIPCILIFLVLWAGCSYLIYLEKVPSLIIRIISFLIAVPLLLFMLLAYVFHLGTVPSLVIAIAVPVGLSVLFSFLADHGKRS